QSENTSTTSSALSSLNLSIYPIPVQNHDILSLVSPTSLPVRYRQFFKMANSPLLNRGNRAPFPPLLGQQARSKPQLTLANAQCEPAKRKASLSQLRYKIDVLARPFRLKF